METIGKGLMAAGLTGTALTVTCAWATGELVSSFGTLASQEVSAMGCAGGFMESLWSPMKRLFTNER
jgi:hypothetical protein